MNKLALTNFRAYVEQAWRDDFAMVVDNGLIASLRPAAQLDHQIKQYDCQGKILAPGFIDTQVNGGGGVMFNQSPNARSLHTIREGHWSGGTTGMLPTLITDDDEVMAQAVDAVTATLGTLPEILGIHLEGPHLSVQRKGVHDAEKIRPFNSHTEALLSRLPARHYLITLAPEHAPEGLIANLSRRGIRVSAGHTAASYDQIRAALDAGLSCFTHLHNAMAPLTSREPGVVGAALEDTQSYMGIIIDGFHLHPTTAKLSIAAKARGKTLLVSDAMATVGSEHHSFELYGQTIYEKDGRCATADGTLAGSALDMISAVRNCVTTLGIPLEEALRMASQYPAEFLAVDHERGHLREGHRADFVLIDSELVLQQTWVGGECRYSAAQKTS
ncbi:MAG: N-acetylglucosamine-6-phosphate deacetylase [Granulosicoccaceae bacterium]